MLIPRMALLAELDEITYEWVRSHFDIVLEREPGNVTQIMDPDFLAASLPASRVEVAVAEAHPFPRSVLRTASPYLRLIASVRTNPANVDTKAAQEYGILVSRSPGRNVDAVAEFTIAQILNCARHIPFAFRALYRGEYLLPENSEHLSNSNDVIWYHPELISGRPYFAFRGRQISGSVLGIVGYGVIGRRVAALAKNLGMKIVYYDPYPHFECPDPDIGDRVEILEDLLAQADFISLHARLSPETEGMINSRTLARMKPTAFLVNTSRGSLIRQSELVIALKNRTIAGAALDVFEDEPLRCDNEILELDNCLCTPHLSGATREVISNHSISVRRNLEAYLSGVPLPDQYCESEAKK